MIFSPGIRILLFVIGLHVLACGNGVEEQLHAKKFPVVVSLSPSITEIIFAVHGEEHLAGVTEYCNYPAAALEIECTGSFGSPVVEAILSLQPDVVISSFQPDPEMVSFLENNGIEFMLVEISTIDQLFAGIRQIGDVLQCSERAEAVSDSLRVELDLVADRTAALDSTSRVNVFVEIWSDPLTTPGGLSFITEIVERAGGQSVSAGISEEYPSVGSEQIVSWNPDVIILLHHNSSVEDLPDLNDRMGWNEINAVRDNRILSHIENELLLRPGPRMVAAVCILNSYFYGAPQEQESR
ncbi:MAG: ABC transporter substrate-binding protein [Candidatus Sabulitectum sp.]|nr:ABC transporter substrate-binding protein [Candidatus Sabulitectum sp.]